MGLRLTATQSEVAAMGVDLGTGYAGNLAAGSAFMGMAELVAYGESHAQADASGLLQPPSECVRREVLLSQMADRNDFDQVGANPKHGPMSSLSAEAIEQLSPSFMRE